MIWSQVRSNFELVILRFASSLVIRTICVVLQENGSHLRKHGRNGSLEQNNNKPFRGILHNPILVYGRLRGILSGGHSDLLTASKQEQYENRKILTSPIIRYYLKNGCAYAETQNSIYQLTTDPDKSLNLNGLWYEDEDEYLE